VKAIVFEDVRKPVVKNVPMPTIGLRDVLIRVARAGICGTDVHIYEGEYFSTFPLIPGHEFFGVVDKIGDEVTTVNYAFRGFNEGSIAAIDETDHSTDAY
jgi:D-arabinitol dehydrogenase (NADP+)